MKIIENLTNATDTVGFVTVTDFEGPVATINIEYLKDAIALLRKFEEIGYTSKKLTVGIADATSRDGHIVKDLMMLFLDEKQSFGIALASILQQGGKNETTLR